MSRGNVCRVSSCEDLGKYVEWCDFHYRRFKKGIPLDAPRRVRPTGEWGAWSRDSSSGYVYRTNRTTGRKQHQHRFVMEQSLGRALRDGENVHHKNGQRDDNRLSNLELWSTKQPPGQRVEDKTAWAIEWLRMYKPGALA